MRTALIVLAGCSGASPTPPVEAPPEAPAGRLRIDEVYYSGAAPAAGVDHYFSDQFVRLVNLSDVPVAAGGVLVGDAFGLAGAINGGDVPDSYATSRPDQVVLENVWRIPGAPEDVVVEPGGYLLLARDGANHQPLSTVDLTGADFETVVRPNSGNDEDYPGVPDLERVHFTGGFDWLVTVFGPSLVVLAPEAEAALEDVGDPSYDLLAAPVEHVVDGVEALMDADSGAFKRLPVHGRVAPKGPCRRGSRGYRRLRRGLRGRRAHSVRAIDSFRFGQD
ncbi:MAG: DUF4876 domain-containing protein [Myxococcota bacterium]